MHMLLLAGTFGTADNWKVPRNPTGHFEGVLNMYACPLKNIKKSKEHYFTILTFNCKTFSFEGNCVHYENS